MEHLCSRKCTACRCTSWSNRMIRRPRMSRLQRKSPNDRHGSGRNNGPCPCGDVLLTKPAVGPHANMAIVANNASPPQEIVSWNLPQLGHAQRAICQLSGVARQRTLDDHDPLVEVSWG